MNQGPVFSGPGAFATQVRDLPPQPPAAAPIPFVGFVWRLSLRRNDWVGAPYAGPRRYVNQRVYYRVKRPARVMQISK